MYKVLIIFVLSILCTGVHAQVELYHYDGVPLIGMSVRDAQKIDVLSRKGLRLDSAAVIYERLLDTHMELQNICRAMVVKDREKILELETELSRWKRVDKYKSDALATVQETVDKYKSRSEKYKKQRNNVIVTGVAILLIIVLLTS